MGQARQTDATRAKPLSLDALREYGALDNLTVPSGVFDPNGAWKHAYQIWLVGRQLSGFLTLERQPAPDSKEVSLIVETRVRQMARTIQQTKARIQCRADQLLMPLSWTLDSVILDPTGQPISLSVIETSGKQSAGTLVTRIGGADRRSEVPAVLTSNWSLFDAVQRLAGKGAPPLEFAILEDLDLVKKDQRLSYWRDGEVELAGKKIHLTGYQQIGRGVLPLQYWVDDQHRLLFVIGGVRAYLLDPDAPKRMQEVPPKGRGGGKKAAAKKAKRNA